jgi:hypothetical protein
MVTLMVLAPNEVLLAAANGMDEGGSSTPCTLYTTPCGGKMWLNDIPLLLYKCSMLRCTPLGVSLATHVACYDALRGVDLHAWYRTTHHRDITGKQTSSKVMSSHQDDPS